MSEEENNQEIGVSNNPENDSNESVIDQISEVALQNIQQEQANDEKSAQGIEEPVNPENITDNSVIDQGPEYNLQDATEFDRHHHVKIREAAARFHNGEVADYLGIAGKLLGMDKQTEHDVAHIEAIDMDKRIDKMVENGAAKDRDDAVTKISFMESSFYPYASYIKLLAKADKISYQEAKEIIIDKEKTYLKKSASFRPPQMFIQSRDRMVDSGIITPEEANNIPEVQKALKSKLIDYSKNCTIEKFIDIRDKIVEAGITTFEEANNLPEVQEALKSKLIGFSINGSSEKFIDIRDKIVEAGIMTFEEANSMSGSAIE